jgi:hypothetical protein
LIVGRTGGGKTQAGVWHLSGRSFETMPWFIFDFKRDELIGALPAQEISVTSNPPRKPGLYVVRPTPGQEEIVETFLWRLHQQTHCGIYIDEGYCIDQRSSALQAILTQGRSLKIPVIILSQRPVWIPRFAISEADFYQVFRLNDQRDYQILRAFIPHDLSERASTLPEYHSFYYDVGKDALTVFTPVSDRDSIVRTFRDRIGPRRKFV